MRIVLSRVITIRLMQSTSNVSHRRRYTVAGRVCMDQVVIDLGPDFEGAAGDEVVVLGRSADGEPCAQQWAEAAGTINYEIVTRMGPRLPRVLLGGEPS